MVQHGLLAFPSGWLKDVFLECTNIQFELHHVADSASARTTCVILGLSHWCIHVGGYQNPTVCKWSIHLDERTFWIFTIHCENMFKQGPSYTSLSRINRWFRSQFIMGFGEFLRRWFSLLSQCFHTSNPAPAHVWWFSLSLQCQGVFIGGWPFVSFSIQLKPPCFTLGLVALSFPPKQSADIGNDSSCDAKKPEVPDYAGDFWVKHGHLKCYWNYITAHLLNRAETWRQSFFGGLDEEIWY